LDMCVVMWGKKFDTHRETQKNFAREGELDAVAQLVFPATLFGAAVSAKPRDARGRSFIRMEGIWVLGSTCDWRRGSEKQRQ
jgi:hypothetical protein